MVNSIGMAVAGILSIFTGWLTDRTGVKGIYLVGIGLLSISYLTYGLAQSWPIIIVAMSAYWIGNTTDIHCCTTVFGNTLANEDRATGMSLCETVAMGLLGMAAPLLGAWLVTVFGGINVSGIRPLFFISLVGTVGTFFLILTQLSNRRWGSRGGIGPSFLKGLAQVFRQGRDLKKGLAISAITFLPFGMLIPFTGPFANEIKRADHNILGWMRFGLAVLPLFLGIPLGRVADKFGRKKVLCVTIPLVWVSSLMLIWAPGPELLVVAGVFQGFIHISSVIVMAMLFELVLREQMGRWMGAIRCSRMLFAAVSSLVAGVIWDNIGPQYVFLAVIGLDVFIRLPLIIGMPETLGLNIGG
jgi:MFS family permease